MNLEQYHQLLREIGCIFTGRPPSLHHPRFCVGMSQLASDWLVIPLAPELHNQGNYGQCIHNGQIDFEKNMGMTEQEMLAETIKRVLTGFKL